jgi:hypothetical protein
MSDNCCNDLETRLQALGLFDPPSPSLSWTIASIASSVVNWPGFGPAIVAVVGTFLAENPQVLQPRDINPSFSQITSIRDLNQEFRTVVDKLPPPSLSTGATGPYNINAILQRIARDFTYNPTAPEAEVLVAFSELQGGFGEELRQFQANLPTSPPQKLLEI